MGHFWRAERPATGACNVVHGFLLSEEAMWGAKPPGAESLHEEGGTWGNVAARSHTVVAMAQPVRTH